MAKRTYTKAKVAIAGAAAGVTVLGATWFAQNQPASATTDPVDNTSQVTAPAATTPAASSQGSSTSSNTSSASAATSTVAPKTTTTTPKKVTTPAARRSRGS